MLDLPMWYRTNYPFQCIVRDANSMELVSHWVIDGNVSSASSAICEPEGKRVVCASEVGVIYDDGSSTFTDEPIKEYFALGLVIFVVTESGNWIFSGYLSKAPDFQPTGIACVEFPVVAMESFGEIIHLVYSDDSESWELRDRTKTRYAVARHSPEFLFRVGGRACVYDGHKFRFKQPVLPIAARTFDTIVFASTTGAPLAYSAKTYRKLRKYSWNGEPIVSAYGSFVITACATLYAVGEAGLIPVAQGVKVHPLTQASRLSTHY